MTSKVSPFVSENIELLNVLCDSKTKGSVITAIFKTANNNLLSAIAEILLNCKQETIPKSVQKTLTIKRGRAKRMLLLRKHWRKLRPILQPVVRRIKHNETS